MKIPKEHISLPNKSALFKDAFSDSEITSVLRRERDSVALNSRKKEQLKKLNLISLPIYLAISAAAAVFVFVMLIQFSPEQSVLSNSSEQVFLGKNCNIDSLLSIREYAPQVQDSFQIVFNESFGIYTLPFMLDSYYSNWQGCGGVIYQDNWWNGGQYGPGGYGFPPMIGNATIEVTMNSIVDTMPCEIADSIHVHDEMVENQNATAQEYLTVKSWIKSEWENRTSFLKRAKIMWRQLRTKDEKEEDYIEIAYKGRSINL
jgi:hypothetical protein